MEVRVVPGAQYALHNRTFTQPIKCYPAATGTANPIINQTVATSYELFTVPGNVSNLFFEASTAAQDVILERNRTDLKSLEFFSPLSFVIKATDLNPRRIVGSFYDIEGKLLTFSYADPINQISFGTWSASPPASPVEPLARTLYWLAENASPDPAGIRIMSEVWEFRGALYGGPVLVTPNYFTVNPASNADAYLNGKVHDRYVPIPGSAILYPGPIRLGGDADSIWQPSTNPGFMDPGVGNVTASVTLNGTGAQTGTTGAQTVDCRGSVLGILLFTVNQNSTKAKTVTVKAKRRTTTLGSPVTTFVSEVLSVDESYAIATGSGTQTFMIELEQGLYDVTFTVTMTDPTNVQTDIVWTVQRLH